MDLAMVYSVLYIVLGLIALQIQHVKLTVSNFSPASYVCFCHPLVVGDLRIQNPFLNNIGLLERAIQSIMHER